jgi:GNAT superfamily N-acetyltransferase
VSRDVTNITLDALDELPKQCRKCVFWELAPHLAEQAAEYGSIELEKEAWVSGVLLEWGSCGKLARVDGLPAGYVMYSPPGAVPRAATFQSGPVSADAVLLTALRVMRDFERTGIGRMLVQAVVRDLTRRGVKAIEAFGEAEPDEPDAHCLIPVNFLLSVGFKTVRQHPRWPRLRLELRSSLNWKEDVEAALEQLLGKVTVPTQASAPREPLLRPAPSPAPSPAGG